MRLYLIRHAQSLNNALPESQRVEDPDLTELGRLQAERLAARAAPWALTSLVCSPFLRTLRTAEAILRRAPFPAAVHADLHEVGGCYAGYPPHPLVGRPGMTCRQIREQFPMLDMESHAFESGWWASRPRETWEQAEERAGRLADWTRRRFNRPEDRVAFVMHADFKGVFLHCLGVPPAQTPWNTSVTELELDDRGARLVDYNCVRHLEEEHRTC